MSRSHDFNHQSMTAADMGSIDKEPPPEWHPQPAYHMKALKGWINDPCAPGYDSETGTYHMFYQWNPRSCDWGHICWGHYTSKDGVHWQHNGKAPVLEPSMPYDKEGIFTGCMHPTGPKGEKSQLTVIYSSIQHLPIHWTIPYIRDCAGLALATSVDGGRTWEKSSLNPILRGEPEGLTVTGFRDPFLAEWKTMDKLRGETSMYGIVSGGVIGKGPNAFVFAVSPTDLSTWTYIGPLCDIPAGFQRPTHWTGDLGVNWECVNFMTLADGEDECEFLLMGTEGGYKKNARPDDKDPHQVWAMWLGGQLTQTADGPRLQHQFNGLLDCGNFYAANSYKHPVTGERIVWGWIKEEELTLARRESKGWTGSLSLPREVFLLTKRNVIGTLKTPLSGIPSLKVTETIGGKSSVQTLGVRPLKSQDALRRSEPRVWKDVDASLGARRLTTASTTSWEMEAVISIASGQPDIGFDIHHNQSMSKRTRISFSPQREVIVVDTSQSNNDPDIQKSPVSGPLTLFICDGGGRDVTEKLHLRIFVDGDVLEVFANERFALSTAVYSEGPSCSGISLYVEDERAGCGTVESIALWEGLGG